MSQDYWIRDVDGRVLGPVSFAVLKDLCSARRLMGVTHVSRDGTVWHTLQQLPELAAMLAPRAEPLVQSEQQAEAARLRTQLHAAASAPSHLIFKVEENAPLSAWRSAYFALARRYHPSRLEAGAHEDLVNAHREAFAFFTRRIGEVEQRFAPAVPAVPPVVQPTPPPPPAEALLRPVPVLRSPPVGAPPSGSDARGALTPPPPQSYVVSPQERPSRVPPPARVSSTPPPSRASSYTPAPLGRLQEYSSEDFVGIERRVADRHHASVRVTTVSYRMFTDHALVNISNSGLFIAAQELIPVGSLVDMELTFEGDDKVVTARARVVWESTGADGRNQRGMGLKLMQVDKQDLAFIKDYVRKAAMAAPSR